MRAISIWPAILGLALAVILVLLLQATGVIHDEVRHSLSYVSGAVVLIALVGWVTEAREVAGPTPETEDEHEEHEEEEEEEEAPGPSMWPIILALGVVGIALGLVYAWPYAALFVAVPMAGFAAAFWAADIRKELESGPAAAPFAVPARPEAVSAPRAGGGGLLMPVPPRTLAAQAAGGAAIAIESVPTHQVSRRGLLRVAFWTGLGGGLAALTAAIVDALYPRGITGFGGIVLAGTVDQFPPGVITTANHNLEGKFWLINLTAEQGGPGFLALWHKCPHLGCTVPWRDDFVFPDPNTGQTVKGWFRCPCHGSTYTPAGVRVAGPAPRPMDHMAVTIDPGTKRISVNSGKITKGTPDNAKFAVKAP
jgi:cytochrome b6-f complex iron-sulfur subunit